MSSRTDLVRYTLHLADNALILGHRNSEWTGHGPILEQDIAISNIALDLVGQARNFYQYAAQLLNEDDTRQQPGGAAAVFHAGTLIPATGITEDHLAYLRDGWDFYNCQLVEQPNGDWACTTLRQFLFSAWQILQYEQLVDGADPQLAAIAAKSIKETTYHLRWSGEWVVRLGDGTEESHDRMQQALQSLWKFTGELFEPAAYEPAGASSPALQARWREQIRSLFDEAGLTMPPMTAVTPGGGKNGKHTEQLGYILSEMQFLQRAYPGCEW